MLGPLLLHWDALASTYQEFLSHIQSVLELQLDAAEIRIGSDEAKALLKAISNVFPCHKIPLQRASE